MTVSEIHFLTIRKERFSCWRCREKISVYYVNTKEITDNKFGTANPVWFRVVDKRINLDKGIEIRCRRSLCSLKLQIRFCFIHRS
ncbi:MAG: hypothetical protein ACLSGB_02095 [Dorea sp.]